MLTTHDVGQRTDIRFGGGDGDGIGERGAVAQQTAGSGGSKGDVRGRGGHGLCPCVARASRGTKNAATKAGEGIGVSPCQMCVKSAAIQADTREEVQKEKKNSSIDVVGKEKLIETTRITTETHRHTHKHQQHSVSRIKNTHPPIVFCLFICVLCQGYESANMQYIELKEEKKKKNNYVTFHWTAIKHCFSFCRVTLHMRCRLLLPLVRLSA